MFINLSNHPSDLWSAEQRQSAREYGEIVDIPFPEINPAADSPDIVRLADAIMTVIRNFGNDTVVHVMGEMTFTYALVSRLKAEGVTCLASTTERVTTMTPTGKKVSEFRFVRFRAY